MGNLQMKAEGRRQKAERRSAFSLVELLVVIAILAILIGLLLPSLRRARQAAMATQCAAQLRGVGQVLLVYVNNNAGYFPGWSGWHVAGGDGTGEDQPGLGWTELLGKEVNPKTSAVWNCPSFPDEFRLNYFLAARYTYLANRRHLRFSEIRYSSQFVLGGDCTQPILYPPQFGTAPMSSDDCDKDDASQQGLVFADEVGGLNMHRGGNNVLFGDGHVELVPRFELGRMTYHPRKMQGWADVTGD
jgi:prepilin-type N-terminal cleavage/methylation domain-containing protein/prepilin-type processing-associated H-X9-DG protein